MIEGPPGHSHAAFGPFGDAADHSTGGAYNDPVALVRPRLFAAFDATAVVGATLSRSLAGRRFERLGRVPLEPGAIVVSPIEPNIKSAEPVRDALLRLTAEIGPRGAVSRLLPDGTARTAILEAPDGVAPADFARFKLAAALPYPAHEAIVDILALGGRRVLAVAVRRSVVESYEAAAATAGLEPERVELAPLAALEGLRRLGPIAGSTVDVILGDAFYSIAAWRDAELRVFRSRRRDTAGVESARLRLEIARTAHLAGDGHGPRVRVAGAGGGALVRELRRLGDAAEPAWSAVGETLPVEAEEIPWLGVGL